jgi:hypothetical protein
LGQRADCPQCGNKIWLRPALEKCNELISSPTRTKSKVLKNLLPFLILLGVGAIVSPLTFLLIRPGKPRIPENFRQTLYTFSLSLQTGLNREEFLKQAANVRAGMNELMSDNRYNLSPALLEVLKRINGGLQMVEKLSDPPIARAQAPECSAVLLYDRGKRSARGTCQACCSTGVGDSDAGRPSGRSLEIARDCAMLI